jgi:N-acetylneuraminic acid mutarotase
MKSTLKTLFLLFFGTFLFVSYAQTQIGFNYQTVIRDSKGDLIKNHQIALKISILSGSATGSVVFAERQEDSTNNFGLLNLIIGEGTKLTGNFNEIDWSKNPYYVKIEVDLNGGLNYTFMGTNRLSAVPYSKFSERSFISINDQDTSKTNEIQEISYNNDSLKLSKANGIRLNRYVPDNNCILGLSVTPPTGYTYSGNYIEMNSWENKARMMSDRYCAASAVVNGKIYVIGGYRQGVYSLTNNEEYDPATNCWSVKANMTTGRSCLGLAVVNNKIYAIGGLKTASTTSNAVEEYNPATNTWVSKANMPTTRANLVCGVINNKIYVVGGNSQTTWYSTNEEYDPLTDTWVTKSSMAYARGGCAAAVYDNHLYTFGGYNNGNCLCYTEVYDPSTDQWVTKVCMPAVTDMAAAVLVKDIIYVIGGINRTTKTEYANNQMYNPKTNSWSAASPMITARHGVCASAVGNKIYVFGGGVPDIELPTNEVFDPAAATYYIHCLISKQ